MIEFEEISVTVDENTSTGGPQPRAGFACGIACENGMVCGAGCGHGVGGTCGFGCSK